MTSRWLRVVWPLALLAVSFGALRHLSEWTRPATPSLDCDRVSPTDISTLQRCAALHVDDEETLADLGKAYERAGQSDRAEDSYRRALVLDPQDGDVHVQLGRLLATRGDRAGAAREGAAALAVQPGRPEALELVRP